MSVREYHWTAAQRAYRPPALVDFNAVPGESGTDIPCRTLPYEPRVVAGSAPTDQARQTIPGLGDVDRPPYAVLALLYAASWDVTITVPEDSETLSGVYTAGTRTDGGDVEGVSYLAASEVYSELNRKRPSNMTFSPGASIDEPTYGYAGMFADTGGTSGFDLIRLDLGVVWAKSLGGIGEGDPPIDNDDSGLYYYPDDDVWQIDTFAFRIDAHTDSGDASTFSTSHTQTGPITFCGHEITYAASGITLTGQIFPASWLTT